MDKRNYVLISGFIFFSFFMIFYYQGIGNHSIKFGGSHFDFGAGDIRFSAPPYMQNVTVYPAKGTNTTMFNFTAWYFDGDGD
ncbi:MAG: hypothetical protein ACTSXP_07645, partial [Promethearchaeota archaeon]